MNQQSNKEGKIRKAMYCLVLAGILAGCGNGSAEKEYVFAHDAIEAAVAGRQALMAEPSSGTVLPETDLLVSGKKIIKNGNIGLKVDNLEEARNRIDALLSSSGGYYSNENFYDYDYEAVYNLTARIPAAVFESFVAGVEKSGYKVVQKSISSSDVTEQFVDIEMRLSNRRRYLERYGELLKQARTIKDMLDIEESTRKIEEEIESAEGRLKYLSDQVMYSTLYLALTREKEFRFEPGRRDGFFERLKQSLAKGWFGLVDFLLFLIKLWPFWLILLILTIFYRKFISGRK